MRRRREEPGALPRLALLLAAAMLCVWALGMCLLTAVTAESAAERFIEENSSLAQTAMNLVARDELAPWRAALYGAAASAPERGEEYLKRGRYDEACGAAAVFDAGGSLIASSAQDYLIARTYTEAQLLAGDTSEGTDRLIFFDRSLLTVEADTLRGIDLWKLTGSFADGAFVPARMERTRLDVLYESAGAASVQSVMDSAGFAWTEVYFDPDAAGTAELYASRVEINCPERSGALDFGRPAGGYVLRGSYQSLDELVSGLGGTVMTGSLDSRYSGRYIVVPSFSGLYLEDGQPAAFYDGEEAAYYAVCAASFSPLSAAMHELALYYASSLALAVLLWLAVLCRVRKQLIIPAQRAGDALLRDGRPSMLTTYILRWREAERLKDGVNRRGYELLELENERARLNRALDYARTAEENRRRMLSAVAHELKTPLAVIHSYAEGLREHIAEDKREKYVSVILSEAERSDAMVLEMLDFSRLEAGRIKLARDEFSLSELARGVFDRLERQLEARRLELSLDFPEPCVVVADEQRIAEAIENLASNAVKYTPEGGRVSARISSDERSCSFSLVNDAQLTPEQLARVWEPFYRADEARTEPGTGLGLAIVRSIITLHGGKCTASSAQGATEFRITLPK